MSDTKFGVNQLNRPTPQWAKVVFRIILYLSAVWAMIAPSITELPEHVIMSIDKWLLIANGVVNVSIKFIGGSEPQPEQ